MATADLSANLPPVADAETDAVTDQATAPLVLEPGSLEAQAAALAAGLPPAETALAAVTLESPSPAADSTDPVLAELAEIKPRARPDAASPAATPAEAVAVAAVEPELVITDPGTTEGTALELAAADFPTSETLSANTLGNVTDVETVAAGAFAPVVDAPATAPARKAPIFDAVEVAEAPAEDPAEKVVVVMSTSGGRNFGVNVGEFTSRFEAERALLKTALAESATLDEGLRKTSQSGGAWRASFLGLTEDQADLACRRLRARAVPCETVGG
jgi:D-alanyl-D-alanine carboxypeptidase